jgi:hypothetical protein
MKSKHIEWNSNYIFVLVDVMMMVLLALNLILIIFDAIFSVGLVNQMFERYTPGFYHFYDTAIHANFLRIDMAFVAVFLGEFFMSWIVAVYRKVYFKWFFYPFIHWYDLLGCIPLDAFRFVRIFRVYSILYRLQTLGVIDVKKSYWGRLFQKYYDILMEEISDHVIVKILSGVQEEATNEGDVIDKIVGEVLIPKRHVIIDWVTHEVRETANNYRERYHVDLQEYVDELIGRAVSQNEEIAVLERVPVFGKAVVSTVQSTVSNVVYNVIDQVLLDLSGDQGRVLVSEMVNSSLEMVGHPERDRELQNVIMEVLVESLEIIKDQVKIKQWKLREEASKVPKEDIGEE